VQQARKKLNLISQQRDLDSLCSMYANCTVSCSFHLNCEMVWMYCTCICMQCDTVLWTKARVF